MREHRPLVTGRTSGTSPFGTKLSNSPHSDFPGSFQRLWRMMRSTLICASFVDTRPFHFSTGSLRTRSGRAGRRWSDRPIQDRWTKPRVIEAHPSVQGRHLPQRRRSFLQYSFPGRVEGCLPQPQRYPPHSHHFHHMRISVRLPSRIVTTNCNFTSH